MKSRRRRQEAGLALHRLDDDRRDLLGGDLCEEQLPQLRKSRLGVGAAIVLRERRPVDLGRQRAHSDLVRMRARGQGHREQRAAVECTLERDHRGPSGVETRELDRVLDRLGAGVEERRLGRTAERGEREQPLGQLDVRLVGHDREVGVDEASHLLARGFEDARMRMSHVQAADTAGEVDEDVPVDVGERGATALLRHDRDRDRLRIRDHARLALEDRGGPRTRDRGANVDGLRRRHGSTLAHQSAAPNG